MNYNEKYAYWLANAEDPEIRAELEAMDDVAREDAFYRDLAFGTGGLRGVIGAGTNRMNVYTVAKASQGLANYVNKICDAKVPRFGAPDVLPDRAVAVSYDSRIKSDLFARVSASVFAANGIKVWLYPELMPTPCLSYATRALNCAAGVMVTASHNPSKYNGYKVYGADGCQITTEGAEAVLGEIEALDVFRDIRKADFEAALDEGLVTYIPKYVYDDFTEKVLGESVLFGDEIDRNVAIVYSPLNGTGLKPVTRALSEAGFTNVTIVAEQKYPDGNFPTCPYPNPEIREAMALGLEYCEKTGADLLIATDPDCDRCGIAVKDGAEYRLMTGNETGVLLLDYVCSQRKKHGKMPARPTFIKTIVTSDLAEKVATGYGAETVNVLTGFKYIGEVIGRMEGEGRESDYICGFEESYGYLTGTYARDKDAVNAAFLIAEMFAYYKTRGISLLDRLNALYRTYGYALNTLYSYVFEGSAGMAKMASIMDAFRTEYCESSCATCENAGKCGKPGAKKLGGDPVTKALDYGVGLDGLPKENVIKLYTANGSAVIRPSGTEPKLKAYITVSAKDREAAAVREQAVKADLERIIKA
ncbi:MAG: phospho-sugar mutase [Firmicutes bacterium]|nr:phospho-sugar mutase [Bacillota bacterium]